MTTRKTPNIGDPKPNTDPLFISTAQVNAWLKKKKLPSTKINIKKARTVLRKEAVDKLPRGRDITVNQPDAPMQIIYGKMRVGGVLSFLHLSTNKEWLYYMVTVAGHQISGFDKLYLDNKEVVFGASPDPRWSTELGSLPADHKIFLQYASGTVGQSAIPDAITALPSYWTANHKQSNRAHFFMIIKYVAELFSEGEPEINCLIRGRPIYDPRTDTEYWTDNAALCIANYLMDTVYGMKVPYTDIDVDSLIAAADICDEDVPLKGGGTEKRYTINGRFDTELSHKEVLSQMASAYGGSVVFTNGKWKFLPAKYRTPTIHLTQDDLRSSPILTTMTPKSELANCIRGSFVSRENEYQTTDFPPSKNLTYLTEDGEELLGEINLPFTTSSTMAQRLAKIELEGIRRGQRLQASWSLKAYPLDLEDTVMITLDRFGFDEKVFKVEDYDFVHSESGLVVDLKLKETDSGETNWNETIDENAITVAPSTNLPNPNSVTAPTDLLLESGTAQLDIRKDGTVFSRLKISWTTPDDIFVQQSGKIQIQYKKDGDSQWSIATEIDGLYTFYRILDVQDGELYNVRIRSVNGVGIASEWVEDSHTVVGKTEKPAPVAFQASVFQDYQVKLKWDASTELDFKEYELRRGVDWDDGTVLGRFKSTTFNDNYLIAGTINYWLKTIDTSGNYSDIAENAVVEIHIPNDVKNLTASCNDNQVLLDWDTPDTGDLPVIKYKIYHTGVNPINLIGEVAGTFGQVIESVGGSYTYAITAIDTGGNEGNPQLITVTVFKPKDFVLHDSQILDVPSGTFHNCIESDINAGRILALIDTDVTWEDHFLDQGWSSFQDAIDAGYPIFAQIAPTDGYWTQEVDYGLILPPSLISVTYDTNVISGDLGISVNIYTKKDVGDPWVINVGQSVFTTDSFRYVKYEFIFTKVDEAGFWEIYNINALVDVKLETDQGIETSTSSGFKNIEFNLDYIFVKSIVPTAVTASSERLTTVLSYDMSNPVADNFDIKFIDNSGTQVARDFSWIARGVVRPPV